MLILWKCIVVGYSDGNESFTGSLFSNYGPLNMLFHFFRYLSYSVFRETFVKKYIKKLSFFSSNFQNPFQDVAYYRKLGYLTFWYWNGGPLNTRLKVEKCVHFLGCFFSKLKMLIFWIYNESITGRRTWKQNWNQTFDCKVVYILGKPVQDMVLDSCLRQIASSQVALFWCF